MAKLGREQAPRGRDSGRRNPEHASSRARSASKLEPGSADPPRAAGVGLPTGADGGVAESEQTRQDLLSSGVWVRRIYEESPIAIEIYDSGGHLLDANQACLSLFGGSAGAQ